MGAAAISDAGVSDHAPIAAHLRDRARQCQGAIIPELVVRDPRCPAMLQQLLCAAQLDRPPAAYQLRRMMDLMIEAARQVRDELQRLP
eukprot:5945202-Pyramimonas_sp.AAC.1